jgi:hypothetical protein
VQVGDKDDSQIAAVTATAEGCHGEVGALSG